MQRTILFVDDDSNTLHSIERAFMDEPYHCLFACDASEALKVLGQFPVHIVVSDLCMPGMDGLTLLRETRRTYPHIGLILLSGHPIVTQGYTENSAITRKVIFDVDQEIFVLTKPWELSKLKGLIEESFCTPAEP